MIELLPFVLIGGAYLLMAVCHAMCIRVSARFLLGSTVRWRWAFTFAGTITGIIVVRQVSAAMIGASAPRVLEVLFELLMNLGIGSWYFSTRASTLDGQLLGWRGGMLLALTAFVFLLLIEHVLSWGAAHLLGIATQP